MACYRVYCTFTNLIASCVVYRACPDALKHGVSCPYKESNYNSSDLQPVIWVHNPGVCILSQITESIGAVQSELWQFGQYRCSSVIIVAVQSLLWQFSQYRSSVSIVAVKSLLWQFSHYRGSSVSIAVQWVLWQFSQYRGSSVIIVAVQSVSWPVERRMTKIPILILSATMAFSSS